MEVHCSVAFLRVIGFSACSYSGLHPPQAYAGRQSAGLIFPTVRLRVSISGPHQERKKDGIPEPGSSTVYLVSCCPQTRPLQFKKVPAQVDRGLASS